MDLTRFLGRLFRGQLRCDAVHSSVVKLFGGRHTLNWSTQPAGLGDCLVSGATRTRLCYCGVVPSPFWALGSDVYTRGS